MSIPTDPDEARLLFKALSALEAKLGTPPTATLDPVGSWQFNFATSTLSVFSDPFHRVPTVRIELFFLRDGQQVLVQQWFFHGDSSYRAPLSFDAKIDAAVATCFSGRTGYR